MTNSVFSQAVDSLLAHMGTDVELSPRSGSSKTIRVIYGKDFSLNNVGSFSQQDYEHQFFCRASDVEDLWHQGHIRYNNKDFSIEHADIQPQGAFLFCE